MPSCIARTHQWVSVRLDHVGRLLVSGRFRTRCLAASHGERDRGIMWRPCWTYITAFIVYDHPLRHALDHGSVRLPREL